MCERVIVIMHMPLCYRRMALPGLIDFLCLLFPFPEIYLKRTLPNLYVRAFMPREEVTNQSIS